MATMSRLDLSAVTAPQADTYLAFTTYVGGTNSLVEPSVYFNPSGYAGFKYWMVAGPYEGSNPAYENPSVWCSNDGQTWQVPPGGSNPIFPAPANGTYVDPQLFEVGGTLYLTWTHAGDIGGISNKVRMTSTTNGTTWATPVTLITSTTGATNDLMSTRFAYDGHLWHAWSLDLSAGLPNRITHRTAASLTGWGSAPVVCTVAVPPGKQLWEFEVVQVQDEWWMLLNVTSTGSTAAGGELYVYTSLDGLTWTGTAAPILRPAFGIAWDQSIYKAGFVPLSDGHQTRLAIWYSAYSQSLGEWHIGYTTANVTPALGLNATFDKVLAALRLAPFVLGDTVNRVNSATQPGVATSGQTYVNDGGTIGVLDGTLYAPAAANSRAKVNAGIADLRARLELPVPGTQAWLMFRYGDTGNYYRFGFTGGQYQLQKVLLNVVSTPAFGPSVVSAGDVLEVLAVGARLRCYLNGAKVVDWTDGTLPFTTQTFVGVQTDNTTTRFGALTVRTP
jgi:hypothetical protein